MRIQTQVKKRIAGLLVLTLLTGMFNSNVYASTLTSQELGAKHLSEVVSLTETSNQNPLVNQDISENKPGTTIPGDDDQNDTKDQNVNENENPNGEQNENPNGEPNENENGTQNEDETQDANETSGQSISQNGSVSQNQGMDLSQMDFQISEEELELIHASLNYQDIDFTIPRVGIGAKRAADRAGIASVLADREIPNSYSAVSENQVTSVKNQNPNGTCWAFSAINSVEASLIMNSDKYTNTNLDLSERHLAYFFYHTAADPLGLTAGDQTEIGDGKLNAGYLQTGGNHAFTTMALTNWISGADEAIAPYYNSSNEEDFELDDSVANTLMAHVQNTYMISIAERDIVKQMIMDYGSVASSYYHDDGCLNMTTGAYHDPEHTTTNHAISIVGWDDNYPITKFNEAKRPQNPGAWLIKNSWGTGYPLKATSGYMWISYETLSLEDGYIYDTSEASLYEKNYHYDGSAGTHAEYLFSKYSYANVYTVSGTGSADLLKAVGVAFYSTNVDYQIDIYADLTDRNDPTSGTKVATKLASTSYQGCYTEPLDEPVRLENGTTFSVVITNAGAAPVAVFTDETYENSNWIKFTNQCAVGESFKKSSTGIWTDFANDSYYVGKTPRIKAFTSSAGEAKNISGCSVQNIVDQTYSGSNLIQENLLVKDGETELVLNQHYKVEYADNCNVGKAKMTIKGIGNYSGEIIKEFNILEKEIAALDIKTIGTEQEYTGTAVSVNEIQVVVDQKVLKEGEDYTVKYTDNIAVGTAKIEVSGINNYKGTHNLTFHIVRANLENLVLISYPENIDQFYYDFEEITPEVTVIRADNGKELVYDTDYSLSYENNQNVGTAIVHVIGKGNYINEATNTFKIIPAALESAIVTLDKEIYEYTGKYVEPVVSVSMNGHVLNVGEHFTIAYKNNVNRSKEGEKEEDKAKVVLTGMGNFSGTTTRNFAIGQGNLESVDAVLSYTSIEWTGIECKPSVTAKFGTRKLIEGEDYTVEYVDNDKIGTAKVILRAVDSPDCDFIGTKELEFQILNKTISKLTATLVTKTYTYDPENPDTEYEPKIVMKDGAYVLLEDVDYTLNYRNNRMAGYATVLIEGCGNYFGTKELAYQIKGIEISTLKCEKIAPKTYHYGLPVTPAPEEIIIKDKNGTRLGSDCYDVSYAQNYECGKATLNIIGKGNYTGIKTVSYQIVPIEFKYAPEGSIELALDGIEMENGLHVDYTGFPIKPQVAANDFWKDDVLDDQGGVLFEGKDYVVTYKNNTLPAGADSVKKPTVIITGKGNYSGKIERTFTIEKPDILDAAFEFTVADAVYQKGKELKPQVKGTYTRLNAKGVPTVMNLVAGRDFTVNYRDNTGALIEDTVGIVEITGKGNFTGSDQKNFRIIHQGLAKDFVVVGVKAQTYNGTNLEFTGEETGLKVYTKGKKALLTENVDYTLSYQNNENVGTATVIIKGIGKYAGELKKTFKIKPRNLKNAFESGEIGIDDIAAQIYTGYPQTPELIVNDRLPEGEETLAFGTDYKLTYSNHTNPSTAKKKAAVTMTGKGNYTGAVKCYFDIVQNEFSSDRLNVVVKTESFYYNGKAQKAVVEISDKITGSVIKPQTAYKVTYTNHKEPGTATVTIAPAGVGWSNVNKQNKPTLTAQFDIVQGDLSNASIVIIKPIAKQKYKGYAVTPKPVVKVNGRLLKQDKDYVVTYENNMGPYRTGEMPSVQIEGIGTYYKGISEKVYFLIY